MKILYKLYSFLSDTEKKTGIFIIFLLIVAAIFEIIGVATIFPFLKLIAEPSLISDHPFVSQLYQYSHYLGIQSPEGFLGLLGFLTLVIITISAGSRAFVVYNLNRYVEKLRFGMGIRLLSAMIKQDYNFFLSENSNDLAKTILSELDALIQTVVRPVIFMISNLFVAIGIILFLFTIDIYLAPILVICFGSAYASIFAIVKSKLSALGTAQVRSNSQRFIIIGEIFAMIKLIKLKKLDEFYLNKYMRPANEYSETQGQRATIAQIPNILVEALIFGILLICTLLLLNFRYDLDEDFLTNVLPAIGLYAFAAIRLKPAVQVIFSGLTGLRYGRRIIDNYASYVTNSDTQIVESKIYDKEFMFKDSLVLKDVCFSYEGSENIIFNCLNVNIEHNTVVGIIGATGVGKTTFVDILLGLLKPSSGGVLIDGVNLNAFGLQNWHNSVGYVPQETIIHDLTIRENIALGVPIELIDEKRLIVCAKNAQIYDFINETNEGFDTILGDRGSRLSGGQKQRIGIARALYSDPDILVFDEATSALDQEVESELISEIVNLADKKTIIMIAHRHATLKCCDRIIELSKDEAKEVTYDDLILAKSR